MIYTAYPDYRKDVGRWFTELWRAERFMRRCQKTKRFRGGWIEDSRGMRLREYGDVPPKPPLVLKAKRMWGQPGHPGIDPFLTLDYTSAFRRDVRKQIDETRRDAMKAAKERKPFAGAVRYAVWDGDERRDYSYKIKWDGQWLYECFERKGIDCSYQNSPRMPPARWLPIAGIDPAPLALPGIGGAGNG